MPPPPIRPPMWNQQPQIPGTDLPPMPPSGNAAYPPPPPPGTSVSLFLKKFSLIKNFDIHKNIFTLKNHRIGQHHCHHHRRNNSHGAMVQTSYHHYQRCHLHHHHRRAVKYIRHHNIIVLTKKGNFHEKNE